MKKYTDIDDLIELCLSYDKGFYLFGAGKMAKEFMENSRLGEYVEGIIDNDSSKWGACFDIYSKGIKGLLEIEKDSNIIITCQKDIYINEIIEQLQNGGFINIVSLKSIIREIQIREEIANGKITTCMIESTNFCNAKCVFCANPILKRKKMHMTESTFEKIVKRLKEEKIYPLNFRLHCLGEPLLDPQLFRKVRRLKEEFPLSKVGYTTNFSVANKKIVDEIIESGQDYITISLNSVNADEYKKIMGLDFERTIANVQLLLDRIKRTESNLEIVVSAVIEKDDEIGQFKEMWNKQGVKTRFMKKGKWGSKDIEYFEADKSRIFYKYICTWLKDELCIHSDGTYALCCFDAEGCIGNMNIRTNSIHEAINSIQKSQLRTMMMMGKKLPNMCENCSFSL
ncbi:MAG: radical SAM protein [Lachnospiraceae bacterium]|nr:radical SAM protein [Lachnospiraceae bacterium]